MTSVRANRWRVRVQICFGKLVRAGRRVSRSHLRAQMAATRGIIVQCRAILMRIARNAAGDSADSCCLASRRLARTTPRMRPLIFRTCSRACLTLRSPSPLRGGALGARSVACGVGFVPRIEARTSPLRPLPAWGRELTAFAAAFVPRAIRALSMSASDLGLLREA